MIRSEWRTINICASFFFISKREHIYFLKSTSEGNAKLSPEDGRLVETYQFNRWIQAISPSLETGTFYLTVYTDDDCNSSRMKLVKAIPHRIVEKNSLTTKMKATRRIH